MNYENAVGYVHSMLGSTLREGDVAIDATVGNGWDTALMADLVGAEGVVYGFDVQSVAIDVTQSRTSGCPATVRLFLHGHESMSECIDPEHVEKVKAITFNLGYLPGGDKEISTHVDTTRRGLDEARRLLSPTGIITVVCYRHSEGERELGVVRELLSMWTQEKYTVVEVSFVNQRGNPPIVFVVSSRSTELTNSIVR
jgi:16S rRNA C1402 N4-methylase RsmH